MDNIIKKEKYIRPVIEIVEFEAEDVITTSGDIPKDDYEGGGY